MPSAWENMVAEKKRMETLYSQINNTPIQPVYAGNPSKPYSEANMWRGDNAAPGSAAPEASYAPGANFGGYAPPNVPGIGMFGQQPPISPTNFNSEWFSNLAQAGLDLQRQNQPLKEERTKLQSGGYRIWKDKKRAASADAQRNRYSVFGQMGDRGVTGRGGFAALSVGNIMNELQRRNEEERKQYGDYRVAELGRGIQQNNKALAQSLIPMAASLGASSKPVTTYLQSLVRGGGEIPLGGLPKPGDASYQDAKSAGLISGNSAGR